MMVERFSASGRLRLIYVRVCIERCDGFQDEAGNFIGLRNHGHVATRQSQRCRLHPLRRVALNRRRDRAVF